MKRFIEWLDGSKKAKAAFLALLVAALSPLLSRLGLDLGVEQAAMIWGTLVAYLLGQGLADVGKESTKLELAEEEEEAGEE